MPDLAYSGRISMTSGPVLPGRTGKSSDFPSGSFRLAVLSAMVFLSGSAKLRDDVLQVGLKGFAAPRDDIPQVVIGQIQQFGQAGIGFPSPEVALQHDVELEQPAPAFPLELFPLETI